MFDPYEHAHTHGLRVHYTDGLPELGRYYANLQTVVLRAGLDTITERCTLTHELGHHHYRHRAATPRTELQADRWAAARLLTKHQVLEIASAYPNNPELWCAELEVTPAILRAWLARPTNQYFLAAAA